MGYATILPALLCLGAAAFLALASLWLAREARRVRFEEREARQRMRALEGATEVPPSPSDMAVVVRFERAGADMMRRVLKRAEPGGAVPLTEVRRAVDPMVDALRLATHAEAFPATDEAPPVRSPLEGGLVACLGVKSRAPLPGLEDPTEREGLAAWLRRFEALEPGKLLSVKLVEVFAASDERAPELRPLHR
jgi:hypothetical protein